MSYARYFYALLCKMEGLYVYLTMDIYSTNVYVHHPAINTTIIKNISTQETHQQLVYSLASGLQPYSVGTFALFG
jgi:hypothetical protein